VVDHGIISVIFLVGMAAAGASVFQLALFSQQKFFQPAVFIAEIAPHDAGTLVIGRGASTVKIPSMSTPRAEV
jgi:hypothetical protein